MQTQRRGGRQPSDQANWLGLRVRQKEMAATVLIHHRHLLLLSPRADTHFTVPRRVEGWVDLGTAVRMYSPSPRLYIAVAVVINTTARGEIWTWVLSHRSQACYHSATVTLQWWQWLSPGRVEATQQGLGLQVRQFTHVVVDSERDEKHTATTGFDWSHAVEHTWLIRNQTTRPRLHQLLKHQRIHHSHLDDQVPCELDSTEKRM